MKKKVITEFHKEILREVRLKNGLTQREMAERLHVATGTYQYWELGRNKPDASNFETIMILLKELGADYRLKDLFSVEEIEIEEEESPYIFDGYLLQKLRVEYAYVDEDGMKVSMSQALLGDIVGRFYSTISKWERGVRICPESMAKKFAKLFEVEDYRVFYLLKEDVIQKLLATPLDEISASCFLSIGKVTYKSGEDYLWDETAVRGLADEKLLKLYHTIFPVTMPETTGKH